MYLQAFVVGCYSVHPGLGVFVGVGITVLANSGKFFFGAGTRLQVFPSKCWKPSSDFEKVFPVNSQLAVVPPHGPAGHLTVCSVRSSAPPPAGVPRDSCLTGRTLCKLNQLNLYVNAMVLTRILSAVKIRH